MVVAQLAGRLAIDVHQIGRAAAGEADVGFLGFTGAVDHAADDRDVERCHDVFEAFLERVHGRDHVEILARAAGAGDEVDALGTQLQAFQHIEADLDLLDRIGGQRDANRVADAVHQQHAEADGGLHCAGTQAAGFGDAQVQRLLDLLGQQPVSRYGHEHVAGLDADLEVGEIEPVEMVDVAHGRLDQRFRGRFAVFLLQILFQRTGVDADTDRDAVMARGIHHRTDTVFAADVAGVDAQAIDTELGHPQGDLVVEMDVGHQWYADLTFDLAESFGGIHVRHRDAHDVGTGLLQTLDLRDGGGDIVGVGVGHALYGDGGTAADRHMADMDLSRETAGDRRWRMHGASQSPRVKRATLLPPVY